jgi:hypothetical protein
MHAGMRAGRFRTASESDRGADFVGARSALHWPGNSLDQRLAGRFLAMRNARWLRSWRPVFALAIAVLASLLPLAAHAQFFGTWDDRPRRQQGSGGIFGFPFFDRPYNPQQPPLYAPRPEESYRAPPPRKLDTQPASMIVVVGDSLADWLAYGLEETYADSPQIGIERKIRPNSGLIRYDPRNEALEWSQAVKDMLAAEKPAAIVVMLGVNDRVPLRAPREIARDAKQEAKPSAPGASTPPAQAGQPAQPPQQAQEAKSATPPAPAAAAQQPDEQAPAAPAPQRPAPGGTYEFHTDEWAQLYAKRIDDMIAVLKSKGVPVVWVGLPAIRGPRSTSEMSYLDDLYHARADKAGIVYVDIWDGFVDDNGRYAVQGPDFEGQIRRLRSGDGVHFSKVGAEKLAHYVEHELTRLMANPVVPVALPVPEASGPAGAAPPGAPRPTIGPVLPLAATRGGEGGDLLGGGSRPSPPSAADPTAASVLVRGEPIAAPTGRADNFTWPRSSAGASAKPAQKATPAASAPSTPTPAANANAPAPAPPSAASVPSQAAAPAPAGAPAAR